MKLSDNFTLEELIKSATAQRLGIDNNPSVVVKNKLATLCRKVLQPLRNKYGKSIVVTCGYRCPRLNKAVGGASTSDHLYGNAADIRSQSDSRADNKALFDLLVKMMKNGEIGVKQIINEYDPDDMTLKVNTKMTMLEDYNNPLRIIIFLVEDGVVKPQKDGNQDILEYTHNHVLRAYLTDAFGYILRDNQFEWHAGDNEVYAAKIDCSETDWVMGNCHVVVALYDPLAIKVLQVEEANVINR